jgi:Ca2+/H+ antiporter
MLATPPQEPTIPRKVIVWTVLTVALLVVGLIVVLAGLKHYERQAAEKKQKSGIPAPIVTNVPASLPTPSSKR